jgi:lipopolysaccharide transport system permease protein
MQSEVAFRYSVKRAAIAGFKELLGGIQHWRVWHLLGINDLRHRYARSKLGQIWLVLSTATMIGVLTGVYSSLFNQPLKVLMPFIGVGLIMWNYLSQVFIECTSIFSSQGNLYRNQKMNFSVSIYAVIYKNTIILAHSLLIIFVLIVALDVPINWHLLQIVPAFGLTWVAMVWSGYMIAMICVRYRDIIQLITTWLTVLFFVTPVMWKPDFLPREARWIVEFNPLAQFLEILRNPILGQPVSSFAWVTTTAIALGGGLIALAVIGRYQRRIIFWT